MRGAILPNLRRVLGGLIGGVWLACESAMAVTGYQRLNSPPRDACSGEQPCRVITNNGATFDLILTSHHESEQKTLEHIQIRNLSNDETQDFPVKGTNTIDENAPYEVYLVHVRPGGVSDLAVHVSNALKEGDVYYYLLFNPQKKQFVLANEKLPRLIFNARDKVFVTPVLSLRYRLDPVTLQFESVQNPK